MIANLDNNHCLLAVLILSLGSVLLSVFGGSLSSDANQAVITKQQLNFTIDFSKNVQAFTVDVADYLVEQQLNQFITAELSVLPIPYEHR